MDDPPGPADTAPSTAGACSEVEADFPGWHVWTSAEGRWWATRTGRDAQWAHGCPVPMTSDADDEAGLRQVLAGWSLAEAS